MAQNDDDKQPEMPNNYMPSYSTGIYGSYILMLSNDTSDDEGQAEPGREPGEQKFDAEQQSFLDESAQKKQHYNQYQSLSNIDVNRVDNSVLVDDPHFVLTLNDLSDFNVDRNKSEVDTLKELQNCIENKIQNPIIDAMRAKLAAVYQVVTTCVVITDIYYGSANIGHLIIGSNGEEIIKTAAGIERRMKTQFKQYTDTKITPKPEKFPPYALIKSYHVSCASNRPNGTCDSKGRPCKNWNCKSGKCRIAGVVLYMKDGETRWRCGGRSCRAGYIIVKQSVNGDLDNVQLDRPCGAIHGKVYKSVFREDPAGIVGAGFSRSGSDGKWKWYSASFNGGSTNKDSNKYHSGGSTMNEIESKWVEEAIRNWWNTGNQNTTVTEKLVIFKE